MELNSKKTGIDPLRSEIKQPDSKGDIRLSVSSDIKRILAIPGNPDMNEFALEIFPGKRAITPFIKIGKKVEKEFKIRPVYFGWFRITRFVFSAVISRNSRSIIAARATSLFIIYSPKYRSSAKMVKTRMAEKFG